MLNPFQYTVLIIFAIVAYMIIVDENVGVYFILVSKIIKINVEKFFWIIRFHPQNPITNLIVKLKYDKIARQLKEEIETNSK
jgi:hypothetical protein